MTMRRDHFSYLLAPGLYDVFVLWLKEHKEIYSQVLNQPPASGRQYEELTKISGFGTMGTKDEGTSVTYDDMVQGGKKRYTFTTFGLAYRITQECYDDELYGVMRKATQALAKSARNCVEVNAHLIFNQATNTTYDGFTDAEALIATSHTLLRGGTYANRPSTDVTLSLAALQAGITSFRKIVDEDNMPVVIPPQVVFIPPDLEFIAREILLSEFKPYSANNEINPIKKDGLTYITSPYLTSTSRWFLLAGKADHDLNLWWRKKLRFDAGEDFDSGDMKNKATQRFISGFGDWRGVYGSAP